MSKNRAWNLASYETYSPQDTASTTAVVEVAVAICLNSLLSSLSPPARQRFLSLSLEMEQNKNNPEVTLIQCVFTVLYLLCQLSKPHAKNLQFLLCKKKEITDRNNK